MGHHEKAMFFLLLIKHQHLKEEEVELHSFLTSSDGDEK